ncbi:MAG: hypothetical protein CM15mP128_5550 [Methanobacteriota archaeon]|nr:MAG: hypothetical protein CM15mP128_5550 [Euryarchaeota archaeon]
MLLYLAAAGVGRLTVIDDDVVSLSNLQRQVIYRMKTLDATRPKWPRNACLTLTPISTFMSIRHALEPEQRLGLAQRP